MSHDFFNSFDSQRSKQATDESLSLPLPGEVPSCDFVLCQDALGEPTAVYGGAHWDLNPIRLGAKKLNLMKYDCFFDDDEDLQAQNALIAEAKYIMFCLMFYVETGRLGRLSASTLYNLFSITRLLCRYSYSQRDRSLVGLLSLKQIFTTPIYLAGFVRVTELGEAHKKFLSSLYHGLKSLGAKHLGYVVSSQLDLKLDPESSKQHPVIPTRIYIEVLNRIGDFVDHIYPYLNRLEVFISNFADDYYGLTHYAQKTLGVGRAERRPTTPQAIDICGLDSLFVNEYKCLHRGAITKVLFKFQFAIKILIHAYTGMRDQEVMRLPYVCLAQEEIDPAVVDISGKTHDPARVVNIISTTTKFEGYRREASWIATPEVIRGVEVAQAICRGLSIIYKVPYADLPLFVAPSALKWKNPNVAVSSLVKRHCPKWLSNISLEDRDLVELGQTDPDRDFSLEPDFTVGGNWSFTGHQFRRSLAFYGSNSGFISLPSLKRQFKHLTSQMSRYYANGFQNLSTIFGYYDAKVDDFVLPPSHIAFEFQMALPIAIANDLLRYVFEDDSLLMGGSGTYIIKQREKLQAQDGILIEEVRADTEKRVREGLLAYKPTLLGGCTKIDPCDDYMLGNYVACTVCEGAIIRPDRLDKAIAAAEQELSGYSVGTGEYQVLKVELDSLVKFRAQRIILRSNDE